MFGLERVEEEKGVGWSFHTCLSSLRVKWSFHTKFVESLMSFRNQILPCHRHDTNHVPHK